MWAIKDGGDFNLGLGSDISGVCDRLADDDAFLLFGGANAALAWRLTRVGAKDY